MNSEHGMTTDDLDGFFASPEAIDDALSSACAAAEAANVPILTEEEFDAIRTGLTQIAEAIIDTTLKLDPPAITRRLAPFAEAIYFHGLLGHIEPQAQNLFLLSLAVGDTLPNRPTKAEAEFNRALALTKQVVERGVIVRVTAQDDDHRTEAVLVHKDVERVFQIWNDTGAVFIFDDDAWNSVLHVLRHKGILTPPKAFLARMYQRHAEAGFPQGTNLPFNAEGEWTGCDRTPDAGPGFTDTCPN